MQNTINKADLRVNQQESIHVINVVGSGMPYLCYSIISMLNYYKQSETRQWQGLHWNDRLPASLAIVQVYAG